MRHDGHTTLPENIIPAPFAGRNQDKVRIGQEYQLIVELTLNADLYRMPLVNLPVQGLIKQMPRAGNAHHPIGNIQGDEVAQLQGCHTDKPAHGHLNHLVAVRHLHPVISSADQSIPIGCGILVPAIGDGKQTKAGDAVLDGKVAGIFYLYGLKADVPGLGSTRLRPGTGHQSKESNKINSSSPVYILLHVCKHLSIIIGFSNA